MAITLATGGMSTDQILAAMGIMDAKTIVYARTLSTDVNGSYVGTLPQAGLIVTVQPVTVGEFTNAVALVGTGVTVNFRKFKSAGLGITLGTLLTVSAFEESSGTVQFHLIACKSV